MHHIAAKTELLRHAGLCDDYYEDGFIGCLRPYSGIRERNFHQVTEAILTVGESIAQSETVDRSTILAIHVLLAEARKYAIDEEGLLVHNKLISLVDRLRFKKQLAVIERITIDLFSGKQPFECIHKYCEYVAEYGWGDNINFFIPLLATALINEEFGDSIQGYCQAIIKLGRMGSSLKNSLETVRLKEWTWFEPVDRCQKETIGYIEKAILAVDS